MSNVMNYSESIAYLFGLQKFGIKLGLSNITAILKYLDNPHKKLRCIHIAGTNGKGSTGAFLLSIFKHNGYRTGFYTSPHLIDFKERIRVNDIEIRQGKVVELVKQIRNLCQKHSLKNITFFEFVTAMAFKYFNDEGADPVIVETGMGGRYDATNVIRPLLSIITSVTIEHQTYLGNTLPEIAREKAGIIKKGVPVISGVSQPAIKNYLRNRCGILNAPFYQLGKEISYRKLKSGNFNYNGRDFTFNNIKSSLIGDHQIRNASLAIAASEQLIKKKFILKADIIKEGINKTIWPGRLEIIRTFPTIVLDGAHNKAAWKALAKALEKYFNYKRLFFLIGIMADKDIGQIIRILAPLAHTVIFCRPKMERAAKREHIEKNIIISDRKRVYWINNVSSGLRKALSLASREDMVCVTGSLFVVGEAREFFYRVNNSSGRIGL